MVRVWRGISSGCAHNVHQLLLLKQVEDFFCFAKPASLDQKLREYAIVIDFDCANPACRLLSISAMFLRICWYALTASMPRNRVLGAMLIAEADHQRSFNSALNFGIARCFGQRQCRKFARQRLFRFLLR